MFYPKLSALAFKTLAKVGGYIVEYVLAAVGRKRHCPLDELVPCALVESALYIGSCHTIFNKGVHQSGVEVVACSDSAHGVDGCHGILLLQSAVRQYGYGLCSVGIHKALAVEGSLGTVHTFGGVLMVYLVEVVALASNDVGILEVLYKIRCNLHHVVAVGRTEVDDVIDNGSRLDRSIADAVAKVAPVTISSILKNNSQLKIVDEATIPKNPTSPNVLKNVLLALLAGLVISLAIAFIRDYFDVKIKYNEEMTTLCKVPVLAAIPDFEYFTNNLKAQQKSSASSDNTN